MSLLTPSESIAFNGFLSAVDFGDVLEWSAIADNVPLPAARGKEALAKATKDLMSLETNYNTPDIDNSHRLKSPATANTQWPSFPPNSEPRRPQQQQYTYGFGSGRPPSRQFYHSTPESLLNGGSSPQAHQQSNNAFNKPRSQSPSTLDSYNPLAPPPFAFLSAPDNQLQGPSRLDPPSSINSPTIIKRNSSSNSKRSLPADGDGAGPSGVSAKRRRPSATTQPPQSPSLDFKTQPSSSTRSKATRASSSSSSTIPTSQDPDPLSKPALLSPSQKRANHIQSEQKRRANIRRGYEALCDVVPALKEAIRQEEEIARAAEDDKGRKRRRRGKAASQPEEGDKFDGRAGPKSENVVLQKTIDHLHALLTEQETLKSRLIRARTALVPGHPALSISSKHLDERGMPLWEREWNGGTGWNDNDNDEADDE
ncbi:hypothetical protein PHLCEN_2v7183 [Hermanssonia centrifuga]|uniref:BHLH domain-containing protein n=1 Tax=Hermanssonia centrifuga TaxID=98765 RepID=A0A2R6NX99_9APHY|nr:hypothetical protein PHLCEN_2v7183 [Hermanssonia centrifuga]